MSKLGGWQKHENTQYALVGLGNDAPLAVGGPNFPPWIKKGKKERKKKSMHVSNVATIMPPPSFRSWKATLCSIWHIIPHHTGFKKRHLVFYPDPFSRQNREFPDFWSSISNFINHCCLVAAIFAICFWSLFIPNVNLASGWVASLFTFLPLGISVVVQRCVGG